MSAATLCDRCGHVVTGSVGHQLISYGTKQRRDGGQFFPCGQSEGKWDLCEDCFREVVRSIDVRRCAAT